MGYSHRSEKTIPTVSGAGDQCCVQRDFQLRVFVRLQVQYDSALITAGHRMPPETPRRLVTDTGPGAVKSQLLHGPDLSAGNRQAAVPDNT